jgi:hypothetical protein
MGVILSGANQSSIVICEVEGPAVVCGVSDAETFPHGLSKKPLNQAV